MLDYLSQSDLIDGLDERNNIKRLNDNIKTILSQELKDQSISFMSFKYISELYHNTPENKLSIEQESIGMLEHVQETILKTKFAHFIQKK